MTTTPRIELRDLRRVLAASGQSVTVLDGVSLSIDAGESVAVLGPSGSGKSTLLALMAGLDRPTAGEVHIDGVRIDELSEDALAGLRRRRIGFVFQSFQLLPGLTALENVIVAVELGNRREVRKNARALLDAVGLADRGHHRPAQLSGGEQQRVAIARAFGNEPDILLADEPTGNLDAATGETVLEQLLELRARRGVTLVLVTHDPSIAERCDRREHLRAGRIEGP